MNFFCAKCQRRHDATAIAADMFTLCKEDMRTGIGDALENAGQKDKDLDISIRDELTDELTRFINTGSLTPISNEHFVGKARFNVFFALNHADMKRIPGARMQSQTMCVDYAVTLEKLFVLYRQYAPNKSETLIEDMKKHLNKDWMQDPVCTKRIKAFFYENGVLEKITDEYNSPAFGGTEMVGFTRICPHCGYELSRASGCGEEIVVALAGSPRAGKTSCMVAMASALTAGATPCLSMLPAQHDKKWEALQQEIRRYNKCLKITKTPSDQKEVPSLSLLLQLNDLRQTKRVLTIVDMPGEFWQSGNGLTADFFTQYSGLYENIDCIWFVISKISVLLSQSEVPEDILDDIRRNASEDLVHIQGSNAANLHMNLSGLKSHLESQGKKMPAALVIVSKPDYFISELDKKNTYEFELLPEQDVANANANELVHLLPQGRTIGLREYEMWGHSDHVRSFIDKHNRSLLQAIESNCADRFYVTLSPYGRPAEEERPGWENDPTYPKPIPYHELYPLLWTLAVNNGILVSHRVTYVKRNFLKMVTASHHEIESVPFNYRVKELRPKDESQLTKDEKERLALRREIIKSLYSNLLMHSKHHQSTNIDL